MKVKNSDINLRIKQLIKEKFNGNESDFAREIGFDGPQKINRLFRIDPRRGEYPQPSSEIIIAIVRAFKEISADWLIFGAHRETAVNEPADGYMSKDEKLNIIISQNKEILTEIQSLSLLKQISEDRELIKNIRENKKTRSEDGA